MRKALLVAVCVGLSGRAAAQAASSVSVDATVVTVGMTISTLRDLNFGTVIKGVPTTILPTALNAGEWQVSGGFRFDNFRVWIDADFLQISRRLFPGSTLKKVIHRLGDNRPDFVDGAELLFRCLG